MITIVLYSFSLEVKIVENIIDSLLLYSLPILSVNAYSLDSKYMQSKTLFLRPRTLVLYTFVLVSLITCLHTAVFARSFFPIESLRIENYNIVYDWMSCIQCSHTNTLTSAHFSPLIPLIHS